MIFIHIYQCFSPGSGANSQAPSVMVAEDSLGSTRYPGGAVKVTVKVDSSDVFPNASGLTSSKFVRTPVGNVMNFGKTT